MSRKQFLVALNFLAVLLLSKPLYSCTCLSPYPADIQSVRNFITYNYPGNPELSLIKFKITDIYLDTLPSSDIVYPGYTVEVLETFLGAEPASETKVIADPTFSTCYYGIPGGSVGDTFVLGLVESMEDDTLFVTPCVYLRKVMHEQICDLYQEDTTLRCFTVSDLADTIAAAIDDLPLAAAEISTIDESVLLYPNPATEMLFIEANSRQYIKAVNLYDISGSRVLSIADQNNKQISLKQLVSGIYFVDIRFANKVVRRRILKL